MDVQRKSVFNIRHVCTSALSNGQLARAFALRQIRVSRQPASVNPVTLTSLESLLPRGNRILPTHTGPELEAMAD